MKSREHVQNQQIETRRDRFILEIIIKINQEEEFFLTLVIGPIVFITIVA